MNDNPLKEIKLAARDMTIVLFVAFCLSWCFEKIYAQDKQPQPAIQIPQTMIDALGAKQYKDRQLAIHALEDLAMTYNAAQLELITEFIETHIKNYQDIEIALNLMVVLKRVWFLANYQLIHDDELDDWGSRGYYRDANFETALEKVLKRKWQEYVKYNNKIRVVDPNK